MSSISYKCDSCLVNLALSFATGWNYVLKYIVATPTNLTAAGLVLQFWRPDLNVAIWITVFGIAIVTINVSLSNLYLVDNAYNPSGTAR